MAHCRDGGATRPLKVVLAAALALAAMDARALVLGEAAVRSGLGENLDLRIPVTIDKGESIEPSCFTLATGPATSVPRLSAARVSLERSAVATYLRIRTQGAVDEPALAVGIVAACPGQFAEIRREYSILIDPPRQARATAKRGAPSVATAASPPPAPSATPAPQSAPSGLPSIATLIARIGDTLESIANAIFPRNRAAKRSYIQALRDTNPPLAALDERDPIPVDTPIALPDLRTFAHTGHRGERRSAMAAPREREAVARERRPAREAPSAREKPPAASRASALPPNERAVPEAGREPREFASPRRPAAMRNQTTAPGFVLKLSSGEMDLSPSRSVDDRMRTQLRDRQLVLDQDDQVAAVLALRNSVRQLESRVAELQLKLAGMPSSFPAPKNAAPTTAAPAVPAPPPAQPQPSAAVPAVTEALPGVAAMPPASQPPPSPPSNTEVAVPPTAPALAAEKPPEATPQPPAAKPQPARSAKPRARDEGIDWLYYGLWALAFLLVAAAIVLATRLARRRREEAYEYDGGTDETPAADDEIVVALEPAPVDDAFAADLDAEPPRAPATPVPAISDTGTHGGTNTDDLRRRYIEERFPEIGKGAISLDQPDSVVKGARLFYEDRAIARAVELLQFAIEHDPGEIKSWLALFEIFRLEGLKGEFAELARRFREQHGQSPYWKKVQYFGREVDPGNELYAEKPLNTLETIGPAQAGRLAAESSFDPVAENWLGAPMDFENEVLANELRKALMAGAGIAEGDLVPNPMPALRNVEMFTVA